MSARHNMLAAIRRAEIAAMDWEPPENQLRTALENDARTRNRWALDQLLRWLNAVERSRAAVDEAASTGARFLQSDPDNLVARLTQAVLRDLQSASNRALPHDASDRFELFREIHGGQGPATRVTLYNAALTDQWRRILEDHFIRRDVAASQARYVPYVQIGGAWVGPIRLHFAVLPTITRRLADLADELRNEGRDDAADACIGWIADLTLGLIEAEPDAGTRLLCADLLAGALGENSTDVPGLRQLRADFHRAALRAPKDLSELRPAVDPDAYNSAFHRLAAAVVLALWALGAAAVFAVACLKAPFAALLRRTKAEVVHQKPCPIYVKLAVALFPSFALALLVASGLETHGMHSHAWGFVIAAAVLTAGALAAIVLAGVLTAPDKKAARRRLAFSTILTLGVILLAAVPPPVIARCYRSLDLAVGAPWVLLGSVHVLTIAAFVMSPARSRTIAAAAATVWCLNITAALVLYQLHRVADERHQQTVVTAHRDEIAARLGPDWQRRYLAQARHAFANGSN